MTNYVQFIRVMVILVCRKHSVLQCLVGLVHLLKLKEMGIQKHTITTMNRPY